MKYQKISTGIIIRYYSLETFNYQRICSVLKGLPCLEGRLNLIPLTPLQKSVEQEKNVNHYLQSPRGLSSLLSSGTPHFINHITYVRKLKHFNI